MVTQLVNKILVDGKKSIAESIVYNALKGVEAKNGQDAVATLKKALDNVRPTLEVKSRRVGGSTYQVPVEVNLQNEILDASNGLGAAVKRREDTHKMAESNRAFAHYRW
ncbi:MAG: 30S ribosomal protein S7 [Microbacterium sp. SCN 70-200]|nr:MAG: 30S ribosomal protein S7 [Microbacterium sp. SCN 70-200]